MDYVEANQWTLWKFLMPVTIMWVIFWLVFVNLAMWAIYRIELPFFERYKINSNPWPWYENKAEWKVLMAKSIKLTAFNALVTLPTLLMFNLASNNWEFKYSVAIEDLPDWQTLMIQVLFCMICEDFGFHFSHRFLHWRAIYPYIHKIHHQHITTVGIAAWYSHPIEFLLGAALPGNLGGLILGKNMHFCTMLLWSMVRTFETLDGHCGYEFSWSPYRLIPFSTSASYHDFHHSHNVGNYSSFFSLWDTVFSQNSVYYTHIERAREALART
jgi:sterol desaturase/sphingolipid hydroxylase (fatty acid hydroxylase superfamily)